MNITSYFNFTSTFVTKTFSSINPFSVFTQKSYCESTYPARKKPPEYEVQYLHLQNDETQIEIGDFGIIDNLFSYLWHPFKILNFIGVDTTKEISNDTIQKVQDYLKCNEMDHVKVCINLYDPENDLNRTMSNPRLSRFTKLTLGLINTVYYTLVPKKIYPVNIYDQYTDTITINTNDVAMALFACAQAKASAVHRNLVSYNIFKDFIPTATPINNISCSIDVLRYLKKYGSSQELETATKTLCASSGMDFAVDILQNPILDNLSSVINFAAIYFFYNGEQPKNLNVSIEDTIFDSIKSSAFIAICAIAGYKYGQYKSAEIKNYL